MFLFKKKQRTILILTGISFFASSIDCLENKLIIIGVLSALVAILNIGASFFVKKYPFNIKITLLVINAIFAALSSYFYFLAGRDKIQYGWAIVSVAYLIAVIVIYKKMLKQKNVNINLSKTNKVL